MIVCCAKHIMPRVTYLNKNKEKLNLIMHSKMNNLIKTHKDNMKKEKLLFHEIIEIADKLDSIEEENI
jgi:hypothetical protein